MSLSKTVMPFLTDFNNKLILAFLRPIATQPGTMVIYYKKMAFEKCVIFTEGNKSKNSKKSGLTLTAVKWIMKFFCIFDNRLEPKNQNWFFFRGYVKPLITYFFDTCPRQKLLSFLTDVKVNSYRQPDSLFNYKKKWPLKNVWLSL